MVWFAPNTVLHEYDRTAYHILALAYSYLYNDDRYLLFARGTQDYIGQPCIAIGYYRGQMYIAANNLWRFNDQQGAPQLGPWLTMRQGVARVEARQPEVVANMGPGVFNRIRANLGVELGLAAADIHFLCNPNPTHEFDTTYHAEMQVVDFIMDRFMSTPDNRWVGVSKPCCQTCAQYLTDSWVRFTARGQHYPHVASPWPVLCPTVYPH